MKPITMHDLKIKVYADGANLQAILEGSQNPLIKGFTTNPTLLRKAGVHDVADFAREVLLAEKSKPVSFEVFADDLDEMHRQALQINTWGENVYVKIPVSNTKRVSCLPLIRELSKSGVKVNVTAIDRKSVV